MPEQTRRLGGRWLQRLISLLFVLTAMLNVLVIIIVIVNCPLWWSHEPMMQLNTVVKIVPLAGAVAAAEPFEIVSTSPALERAMIDAMEGRLSLVFHSGWIGWVFALMVPVILGLALWILWILDRLVTDLLSGRSFTEENASRLRLIGMLVVVASIVEPGSDFLMSMWLEKQVEVAGAELLPAIPHNSLPVFMLGWLVVIIGEAFRRGAAMREEQEWTV